ncbi:family 43 glycosylhydrolase [Microbacteriaceae bacterium VKM Ac-2854]|nr:family 43 glycosylhydrolase [Microbacteriaceae bacterium VKM Ac-2854]
MAVHAVVNPDLAWDEDGRCLVTYCSTVPGFEGIAQAEVDLGTGRALTDPRLIWNGTGLAFPEGPHLYAVDGWWYLVIAEGGTERGHTVSVARSLHPDGPFEPAPTGPLLTHRSTTHPVQNVGHADLVTTTDGSWAVVYLGVRPRGMTPMFHVNGRETFLAGIDWIDGWPVVDEDRFDRVPTSTSWVDTFDAAQLHPRWISPGVALDSMATLIPGSGIELRPGTAESGALSALTARIEDLAWSLDVDLDASEGSAAFVIRLDDRHWCEVRVDGSDLIALARVGSVHAQIGAATVIDAAHVQLQLCSVESRTAGPDDLVFSVITDQAAVEIARLDGRYHSTEVAGGFTGRVAGIRATEGVVRVRRVTYVGQDTRYPPSEE